jgi:hypothetical protein
MLEWTGQAALDAADVGEQMGMLFDVEEERRRAVVRGRDRAGRRAGDAADRGRLRQHEPRICSSRCFQPSGRT